MSYKMLFITELTSIQRSLFCIVYLCDDNLHSYWTNDGACYYDFNGSIYEKTLAAVKEQADKYGIPYRYVQVTSSSYVLLKLIMQLF